MIINKKRILISHQSTIPHYRVPFYNALQKVKSDRWEFVVVFDKKGESKKDFFLEPLDTELFNFKWVDTKTISVKLFGMRLSFQTFIFHIFSYDLIVIENSLNNVSYPLTYLSKLFGKKIALWGHARDFKFSSYPLWKSVAEQIKKRLVQLSDIFFAYTSKEKELLQVEGIKVVSLDNTIDIEENREIFLKTYSKKNEIKKQLGLEGAKVLLYVGRQNHRKRLDFLIESFNILHTIDNSYRLIVIGSDSKSFLCNLDSIKICDPSLVSFTGIKTKPADLVSFYVASDLYLFPGDIGLGPLQSLCYDLIPVVIHSHTHGPEYQYLNEKNSMILNEGATPTDYANAIDSLIKDENRIQYLRENAWRSIAHLTIQNMAKNFAQGIESIL